MRIAVLGATGFVGSAIAREVITSGNDLIAVRAPRFSSASRTVDQIAQHAVQIMNGSDCLELLDDCDVVINSAGVAAPGEILTDRLVGGNALLPALVALRMSRQRGRRMIQISTAAVHGTGRKLDERADPHPDSPYAASKLLGELLAAHCAGTATELVVYRPTSVHGAGRAMTGALIRFSRSPLRSVASDGARPTPQALVENVARVARHLATTDPVPRHALIHPWEGVTTGAFLYGMSGGKAPHHIPMAISKAIVRVARFAGRLHPRLMANATRLDMLWNGQEQRNCWLEKHGPEMAREWSDYYRAISEETAGAGF